MVAPWLVVRSSRLRHPSAQIDELSAEEGRGAHRDASGGERSVLESSEASRRRRPRSGERSDARLRLNPRKSRPKPRSGGTYGFGGSRWNSWTRRRRRFALGRRSSPAAVRARAAVGEKGEGGRLARVFIGGRLWRTRKGAGRADWLPSLQVRRTGGFHSGVRHYRDGGRKAREGERKGRWGTDVRASCHSERKGEPVAVRVRR